MTTRKKSKLKKESRSFTTRISQEAWEKVDEYKKYGNWNTNQVMNFALNSFFEIIESKEKNPELPLVCQTLRDMTKRTRAKFK
ncbi:MAG: hypothetical protein CMI26_05715 [Opitutae bacterium]|nr:hypothetical protein [Opitutae bacterium]